MLEMTREDDASNMAQRTQELIAPAEAIFLLAFVNTRYGQAKRLRDAWPDGEALARWLRDQELLPPAAQITEGDYRRTVAFREALRHILREHTGATADGVAEVDGRPAEDIALEEARATLDHIARSALLRVQFAGQTQAQLAPESGGLDGVFARALGAMYTLMATDRWPRLKVCHNHACGKAFFDSSKNLSAVWCSSGGCGARMRARAYRQAHKA